MNTTKNYNWSDLVTEFEGKSEQPVTYEFSSGKTFKEEPNRVYPQPESE